MDIYEISKNVTSKIAEIGNIWKEIGLSDHIYSERSEHLKRHLYRLLDNMIEEESQNKLQLENNIIKLKKDIEVLSTELEISTSFLNKNSLVQFEESLLSQNAELLSLKQSRVERCQKLFSIKESLCQKLFEEHHVMDKYIILSEGKLLDLDAEIKGLQNIQQSKRKEFLSKRSEIVNLFEHLIEKEPTDLLVESICSDKDGTQVPLTKTFLAQCDEIIEQLNDEYERNKDECTKLRDRYSTLFEILYPNRDRTSYNKYASKDSQDFTMKTLNMLKNEVLILERCRQDRLEEFITVYRNKITEKLNLNLLSHLEEKEPCLSMLSSNFDDRDALLQSLEQYYNHLTEIEKQVSPIVQELDNWKVCLSKFNESKMRLKDPIVLKNRGGILLKVEKETTAAQKELPKCEARIDKLLSSFTSEIINADDLLVEVMRVLDYLYNQCNIGDKENDRSVKNDLSKSFGKKPAPRAPLAKAVVNVVNPPVKTKDVSSSDKVTFKIPQMKKEPAVKVVRQAISSVTKLDGRRAPPSNLDKRMSRSYSDLSMTPLKKSQLTTSSRNLYSHFCGNCYNTSAVQDHIEPGVATSSFIHKIPIFKR